MSSVVIKIMALKNLNLSQITVVAKVAISFNCSAIVNQNCMDLAAPSEDNLHFSLNHMGISVSIDGKKTANLG